MTLLEFLTLVCLVVNLCIGITGIVVLKQARKLNKEFEKLLKELK